MATKTAQQVAGMTQGSGGVMTEALAGGGSKTWTPVYNSHPCSAATAGGNGLGIALAVNI